MRNFKDLNIKVPVKSFSGDKLKIARVLNRQIIVLDYRIADSIHEKGGQCLHLSFTLEDKEHVLFTGSKRLMAQIEEVPKTEFPFLTTIIEENEYYEFS